MSGCRRPRPESQQRQIRGVAVEALPKWIGWARRCRITAFVDLQRRTVPPQASILAAIPLLTHPLVPSRGRLTGASTGLLVTPSRSCCNWRSHQASTGGVVMLPATCLAPFATYAVEIPRFDQAGPVTAHSQGDHLAEKSVEVTVVPPARRYLGLVTDLPEAPPSVALPTGPQSRGCAMIRLSAVIPSSLFVRAHVRAVVMSRPGPEVALPAPG